MSKLYLLLALCCCFCCYSCKTRHYLSGKTPAPAALTQQLGFKVTRHDDLKLYTEAAQWLKTPYKYGGNTKKGVDCSGLVHHLYNDVYHTTLPRTVSSMAEKSCRKISRNTLKTGDLVFFNTSRKKKKGMNHVGLFLKNDYFIHSSTSKGVIISNLREDYYQQTWKQGGRVKK